MIVFRQAHLFPPSLIASGAKLPNGLMIGLRRSASRGSVDPRVVGMGFSALPYQGDA